MSSSDGLVTELGILKLGALAELSARGVYSGGEELARCPTGGMRTDTKSEILSSLLSLSSMILSANFGFLLLLTCTTRRGLLDSDGLDPELDVLDPGGERSKR